MSKSQEARILEYLKMGNKISGLEALNMGLGIRLASRISALKKAGNDIRDAWEEKNGARYKYYWLYKPTENPDFFMSKCAQDQHRWATA